MDGGGSSDASTPSISVAAEVSAVEARREVEIPDRPSREAGSPPTERAGGRLPQVRGRLRTPQGLVLGLFQRVLLRSLAFDGGQQAGSNRLP
jgi:hypothetical protein